MKGICALRNCFSTSVLKNFNRIGVSTSFEAATTPFLWSSSFKSQCIPSARFLHTSALRLLGVSLSSEVNHMAFRRNSRKRRPLTAVYDSQPDNGPHIVSVALAESFDLASVFKDERLTTVYIATCVDEESDEGLHFVPKPADVIRDDTVREFFVFEDGVVVLWGIENRERDHVIHLLGEHAIGLYKPELVEEETDSMSFSIINGSKSRVSKNHLYLDVSNYDGNHNTNCSTLERYAFSHGMAASVKVGIWESRLLGQAEPLARSTKALSKGVIPWRRKEALKKTGQFAELR